ncbi:uncharacterized protein [Zea mays]|uniref:uncharacterized protein n=1 Tax=Zea mays TaxID=4577 RepID=UPI0004DE990F|nr:uncharacterized protein LOC111589307 [Zea mays]|eukprot:XP_023155892.1 uncharacterized protein LOC111589307 [Zea mays]
MACGLGTSPAAMLLACCMRGQAYSSQSSTLHRDPRRIARVRLLSTARRDERRRAGRGRVSSRGRGPAPKVTDGDWGEDCPGFFHGTTTRKALVVAQLKTKQSDGPGRRQRKGKPHTRHRCPWRCRKRGSVERRRCPRLALLSNRSEVSVPQYRMDAGCVSVFRWGIPHDYGRNARTGRCQTRQLWFRVRFWSPFGVLGSRMSAQIDLPILSRF